MISEKELLKLYKIKLNHLLDDCDWISTVSSYMVCNIVTNVLLEKGIIIESDYLHKHYINYIDNLKISDEDWRNNFDISEVISIIYSVLKSKTFNL